MIVRDAQRLPKAITNIHDSHYVGIGFAHNLRKRTPVAGEDYPVALAC
jgi:hypothetical protein